MKAKFAVLLLALVVVSLVALTGCSYPRVEVPNAHVGKVLTSSGFQKGIKTPSTFRLPLNILGLNPTELALVEASDQHKEEKMSLFMPKDRLIMEFDVRGTFTINSGEDDVEAILQRVPAYSGTYVSTEAGAAAVTVKAPSYTSLVDFDDVYAIYGQQIVLTKTRAVLSKYEIDYVLAHREEINAELENGVRERLAHTPL
jgi:hypothetical protein